jgi:gluconolactonase
MNPSRAVLASFGLIISLFTFPLMAADDYQPGPDSKPQPGVPKGDVLKFTLEDSKFFPGTRHDY